MLEVGDWWNSLTNTGDFSLPDTATPAPAAAPDAGGGSDWFAILNKTGQVALQTAGQVFTANAQAQIQQQAKADQDFARERSFQQGLTLASLGIGQNPLNGPNGKTLIIVLGIGLVALFVVNQANK
jgi:hypothetical protein